MSGGKRQDASRAAWGAGAGVEGAAGFRVLVVDDQHLYAQAIGRELAREGIAYDLAYSAAEAIERAERGWYQVILLDHRLPDDDGIRIIPILLARQSTAALVMMTAYETIPNAIRALRQGAEDYVVKETSLRPLVARVLQLRRRARFREGATGLDEHREGGLLGRSPGIVRVAEQLEKLSRRQETTVLLTGETGVGKEVAARHLHTLSGDPARPFVAVDCVALPENLVESLLFGHERGAFTGADTRREGAFHEAGEGTVFLDEIGDMDLGLQGKLLRVLESRRYQRVGSTREHPVRARVVAATNRDLAEDAEAGRFRFDLYQRLAVFPLELPPLRERGRDVLLLARHFLAFFAAKMDVALEPLSAEIESLLLAYDFPGNVRELKNMIERAAVLAEAERIELRHLPERVLRRAEGRTPAVGAAKEAVPVDFVPGVDTLESLETKMIVRALREAGGVKTQAARLLGISRFQLLRRMEKHGMKPSAASRGASGGEGGEGGDGE